MGLLFLGFLLFKDCGNVYVECELNDLGDGYVYSYDTDEIYSDFDTKSHTLRPLIPRTVGRFGYYYDEKFIIARNDETDNWKYDKLYDPAVGDSIHYWIIDKSNKTCYGPMDSLRYIHVRDSLGVNLNFERKPFDWWKQ